jgi:hypothetical protein
MKSKRNLGILLVAVYIIAVSYMEVKHIPLGVIGYIVPGLALLIGVCLLLGQP